MAKQNRQTTKITLTAIAILMVLTFTAGTAAAATLEWKTNPQIDSCACEAQRFTAQISNDGSTAQKFVLTADFDAHANAFSSFIAPSVQVAANSKKTVTLIAAPSCETQNGEYAFTLTAEGSNGIKTSIDGVIRVVECNSLKVNAPIEIPACSGETAAFDVRVANDGEARATGSIVTDLTKNSYTLSETSFDLAAGAEKTVTLRVTIPSRTPPGAIPFKITAVAQGVYAEALTQVKVLDCSGLRILAPNAISVAPSTSQKQNVALRNDAAGDDSFTLSLAQCPSWIALETKSVSLAASSSGTAILVITPPNEAAGKEFNCTLRGRSSKRGNYFEATTLVRVSLPSSAALSIPSNADYCQADGPQAGKAGATANVSFSVRNKGVEQGTFEITASGAPGTVDAELASIAPGEAKQFVFTLDLTQAGEYALTIHVKSAFGSTSKTIALRVLKCNSFEATLSPDKTTICPNETKNFTLTIRNTGTRADSYAVTTQAPGFAASVSGYATTIEAGSAGSLIVSLTAPDGAPAGEARTLIAVVKSNALQQTKNAGAALQIADAQYCAAFAGGNAGANGGATGEFTSLYTGLAGFLIALIAGLFIVFFLAGRKKTDESAENESEEGNEGKKESDAASEEEKEEKPKKPVKRGRNQRGR